MSPSIPPVSSISTDLTKANLEKLSKDQVCQVYNDWFSTSMLAKTTASKDAIITSYIAKTHMPAKLPTAPKPQAPKAITSTQYTIVRNLSSSGLAHINAWNTEAAPLVRRLQHAIRQQFPLDQRVPVELIGGC